MPTRRSSSTSSSAAPAPAATARRKTAETRASSPFALGVLLLVVLVGGYLAISQRFGGRTPEPAPTGENAAQMDEDDVAALVKNVSQHILVKNDEVPTIATIQDPDLLRQQSPYFYKDAQTGDRLLVWSDKAVLYSPSRDLLLAVLPVSIPVEPTTTSSASIPETTSSTVQEVASIEVRNGTRTVGLGRKMTDVLKGSGLTVLTTTDARLKNYEKTIILVKDESKPLPMTLQTLMDVTGASVTSTPVGETSPRGDFTIIVGADFQP